MELLTDEDVLVKSLYYADQASVMVSEREMMKVVEFLNDDVVIENL